MNIYGKLVSVAGCKDTKSLIYVSYINDDGVLEEKLFPQALIQKVCGTQKWELFARKLKRLEKGTYENISISLDANDAGLNWLRECLLVYTADFEDWDCISVIAYELVSKDTKAELIFRSEETGIYLMRLSCNGYLNNKMILGMSDHVVCLGELECTSVDFLMQGDLIAGIKIDEVTYFMETDDFVFGVWKK